MKAAPFAYQRPATVNAAVALMTETSGAAKIIAGGQSLGPMLNLRLVQPELVIDITGLSELKQAERDGDELVIGACVTHGDIEDGRIPDVTRGAMQRVASNIAYRAVRNRGTIGGSLSHADPAADWVSALPALGAKVRLRNPDGTRDLPVEDFMTGALESALAANELVESVRVPAMRASARWAYVKACRKPGEFAHAIAAVLIDPEAATGRVVIGAIEAPPIVLRDASELFGGKITGNFKKEFVAGAADALLKKAGLSNAADRHIHVAILRRAVEEAAA
ncbi:MAG TPA: FAD binding domain-containing protein [Bradyrhizobium sp.]|uniref:FAD binding domain-containing protein n=1 Tax=Bradyrhizobium sp. TaxID=376 RepID=UPI002D8094AE|nr:FAD binding domain-containing protein [Bradyrhizobium sp.]HET7888281.1 FAD binding domain-containing protein [Bradyrhizobium sp.]